MSLDKAIIRQTPMALVPGTRLGPYEIVAPLGAGGMGEVYRARDTRLERPVAIKIIPLHLADRVEARERFEREAHAISRLNHPHICQLYDIGEENGIHFLVMELLEGETLAFRLLRGRVTYRSSAALWSRGRGRPGTGASHRRRASRFEARQYHADQGGRQADGLRSGEGGGYSPIVGGAGGHRSM